jgi:hypothetical protein
MNELISGIVLSFPEVTEAPHFEKISYRVKDKIFATIGENADLICVKLSVFDQDIFCLHDPKIIFPVPNKWGKLGWTYVDLKSISKGMLKEILVSAYCAVAPKKLAEGLRSESQK